MKWKCLNGVYELSFSTDDFYEMKCGGIFTVKTKSGDLIVVRRE